MGENFNSVSNQKVHQPDVPRDDCGFAGSCPRAGGRRSRFAGFEGIENELRRIVAAQRIFQIAHSLRRNLRSAESSEENSSLSKSKIKKSAKVLSAPDHVSEKTDRVDAPVTGKKNSAARRYFDSSLLKCLATEKSRKPAMVKKIMAVPVPMAYSTSFSCVCPRSP